MNAQLTKNSFDGCYNAKHIIKHLPPLPEWMSPRQVTILDVIHQLSQTQKLVCISDVANFLNGTMPSITRMITELAAHGAIEKVPDPSDKRVHSLTLTAYGEALHEYYIEGFHQHLTRLLATIGEKDIRTAISVIDRAEALLRTDDVLQTIPDKKRRLN